MVKYLQIDTAANGNILIALENLLWIDAASTTQVRIAYSQIYGGLDQVKLSHPADSTSTSKIGSMVDALRKIVIDVAKGRWSTPVVNITSLLPKPITSMTLT